MYAPPKLTESVCLVELCFNAGKIEESSISYFFIKDMLDPAGTRRRYNIVSTLWRHIVIDTTLF